MGTMGGNICNASPAGDMIPPLLSMNAKVELASEEATRTVDLDKFYLGPGKTVMKSGELLKRIVAPPLPSGYGTSFVKICRTAEDLAKVSVATVLTQKDGRLADVRISLGAVAPTVIRATELEAYLDGKIFSDEVIEHTMALARDAISPISDLRSSAEYRKAVTGVAVKRSILQALQRSVA